MAASPPFLLAPAPTKSIDFKLANSSLNLLHIRHINETDGDGDGPRTPPRWLEGVWKKFQITNLTMPNNFSFIRYAQKTVPGLADVGVPHGDEGPSQGWIGMAGIHPDVIGVRNFFLNDL